MTDKTLDVTTLGQVFTPPAIVERMLGLMRRHGRTLDPACGDGAFSARLPGCIAIELDTRHCPSGALNQDFFDYPESEQFDTIIGNPPYIKARDIQPGTALRLHSTLLNGHANLYFHFIEKCIRHLKPGGELIFITPREFLKATGAAQLNVWLHDQGSITDLIELGDAKIFTGALPNCIIWRFEKGDFARRLGDGRRMRLTGGQLMFTRGIYSVPLASIFGVKVGGVSGADEIFASGELGNADFVCSRTAQTDELRRMIYLDREPNAHAPRHAAARGYLAEHKERLLARRVTSFDESNWWCWGRRPPASKAPRIYVNHKTRNPRPFFLHPCNNFDGAVLALFPHAQDRNALVTLTGMLNDVDWAELGFVCDGRFLFAQRSLAHALLPEDFAPFAMEKKNLSPLPASGKSARESGGFLRDESAR
jgi:adenine-specific DNA-methyltransferase